MFNTSVLDCRHPVTRPSAEDVLPRLGVQRRHPALPSVAAALLGWSVGSMMAQAPSRATP
jgi:hypothetical protein